MSEKYRLNQSGQEIQYNLDLISNNFAPSFSTESTYGVGSLVVYNGGLYKCTIAVENAGPWTGASNWTSVYLTEGLCKNPMTTPGDLIIGGASGTPTRLGKGISGQVLKTTVNGVEWGDESGGGGTDTWRNIKVNGTQVLGTGTDTDALDLQQGSNVTIRENSGVVTISATSSDNIFIATYKSSTYDEIDAAFTAEKMIFCRYSGTDNNYPFVGIFSLTLKTSDDTYKFTGIPNNIDNATTTAMVEITITPNDGDGDWDLQVINPCVYNIGNPQGSGGNAPPSWSEVSKASVLGQFPISSWLKTADTRPCYTLAKLKTSADQYNREALFTMIEPTSINFLTGTIIPDPITGVPTTHWEETSIPLCNITNGVAYREV